MNLYLSFARYVVALLRMQQRIKDGEELYLEDSDEIGNKFTTTSWGLCTFNWPKQDLNNTAPKYRGDGQACPFDENPSEGDQYGCYYRCRLFQSGNRPLPTREEAVALYEIKIQEKVK